MENMHLLPLTLNTTKYIHLTTLAGRVTEDISRLWTSGSC